MASNAPSLAAPAPGRLRDFSASHPADAWFFPAIVAIIWLLMLAGFVPELISRSSGNVRPYPLVIHAHAIVFFGWLVFLASQVALVRTGNIAWHRRMGIVGIGLAVAVIIFGPAAALTQQFAHVARQPPHFLAIQIVSIVGFAGFITAGLLFRRQAAAHKRLMIIGTLSLIGAGFGRVIRLVTGAPPPFTLLPSVYIAANLMLVAIAIYDYSTRGRLHPVFLPAAGIFLALQLAAGLLLRSAAWIEFTRALVN